MDFRPSEQHELLRRTVREFAESEIRPHVREWDEAQHFPVELVPKLAALGLLGIQVGESYGGAGMSAIEYCICIEEIARVDPGLALSVAAHNGLCTAHIAAFGTRGAEATVPCPSGSRRENRRVGSHRVDLRQRRGGDANERDARRRRLGAQWIEDVHDAWASGARSWS